MTQPHDELVQVEVAGESYHADGIRGAFAEHQVTLTAHGSAIDNLPCVLVPEPWNPHDRNAIAVFLGEHHVGYFPADDAEEHAEPLNALAVRGALATGVARMWARDDAGVIRARVTVLIAEAMLFYP